LVQIVVQVAVPVVVEVEVQVAVVQGGMNSKIFCVALTMIEKRSGVCTSGGWRGPMNTVYST
jgi:hypothetical protein